MMDNALLQVYLERLETGDSYLFQDWPNSLVPQVAAGVYTIWKQEQFIYVGMSGRGLREMDISNHREANARGKGLFSRLNAHASGRRSGDQFCVYVSDRLVLPSLNSTQIQNIASGKEFLDHLVRKYIREQLSYRFTETPDGETARQVESCIRQGALSSGKPFLNPL